MKKIDFQKLNTINAKALDETKYVQLSHILQKYIRHYQLQCSLATKEIVFNYYASFLEVLYELLHLVDDETLSNLFKYSFTLRNNISGPSEYELENKKVYPFDSPSLRTDFNYDDFDDLPF